MNTNSPLHEARLDYQPKVPEALRNLSDLNTLAGEATRVDADEPEIRNLFPKTYGQPLLEFVQGTGIEARALRVGLVFSGGQAAGGHNVVAGIYDALKELHSGCQVFGFLNGPAGIVKGEFQELTGDLVDAYRNQGGFDLIGSGRTKIETPEQFVASEKVCREMALDGLVVIGGDDSNTNAALLAEAFEQNDCPTRVIGVPKTIDGDLKNEHVEVSFGFDTAAKMYSETIGNLQRDALSAGKYYFFVKLMGRSASHIALECALQTHPNLVLIGEEIAEKRLTLQQVTDLICDVICARAKRGKDYGVVLIPEGIIEFIPEFRELIQALNSLLAPGRDYVIQLDALKDAKKRLDFVAEHLDAEVRACFLAIPPEIQQQLLLDRDPHGNVQVSKIETERLFIQTVQGELRRRAVINEYQGSFNPQPYFCGYEGRSCLPSNFDAQYCYSLGRVAALLIKQGHTGYMACVQGLSQKVNSWKPAGVPITMLLHLEERSGKIKPVIRKALLELDGAVFGKLDAERLSWQVDDAYLYPGPIQFFGPENLVEATSETLLLEQQVQILAGQ